MNRSLLSFLLSLLAVAATAQSITWLPQQKMSKWHIPAANYSGIAALGNDRYAVVNDAAAKDGWYEFRILIDPATGHIQDVQLLGIHNNNLPPRDAEGIAFVPETNTLFISAEDDQRIIEYYLNGNRTDRELAVPEMMAKGSIYPNYGFEALAYSPSDSLFWTTTESTLPQDGEKPTATASLSAKLRLQAFGPDMQPRGQYLYHTDRPTAQKPAHRYAFGVPAIAALDNGQLLVMEREFYVAEHGVGSFVESKIYKVSPLAESQGEALIANQYEALSASPLNPLPKTLLSSWRTALTATRQDLANYEGMCLGPRLNDGRQTILLISDSQNGYGNKLFRLKDYLRVGILNPNQ